MSFQVALLFFCHYFSSTKKVPKGCWAVVMRFNFSLNESLSHCCAAVPWQHFTPTPPPKKSAKQDTLASLALKRAPLLWWKMQPVSLLIAVAFRWLNVVIWRACSVKAISPACGLMLRLSKPDHCHFPNRLRGGREENPRSVGNNLQGKGCDCASISHSEDHSPASPKQ